jgi:hypothetical protein
MKTITLTEAYNQATAGPLVPSPHSLPMGELGYGTCINGGPHEERRVADCYREGHQVNAALLAHAFNTLPKVVEALRQTTAWLRRIREEHESLVIEHGPDGDFNLCEAEGLLAEAESVQVPE